jgi:large subunit ribosomal protein L20
MPRVRKGAARAQGRKRILLKARGYYGVKSRHKYQAENALIRAGVYQYRDRRRIKRDMRKLWITRITAACRMRGTRYSLFINGLKMAGITLNRKMLSQVAIEDPRVFDKIVETAKKAARANGGGASAPTPTTGGGGDLINIEGVGPAFRTKLGAIGISWIKDLLAQGATKKGRADIAAKSGINEAKILTWVNMADMMRIKGVDGDMAELMHAAGVDTVKELATRIAGNLAAKMAETNTSGAKKIAPRVPAEAEVAGWIDAAKKLSPVVEH